MANEPGFLVDRRRQVANRVVRIAVRVMAVVLVLGLPGASRADGARPGAPDPLASEAERRNDELVKQGFNLTKGVTLAGARSMQLELLVAPDDDEHIVSMWFETARGELSLRWLGPAGEVVTEWSGRSVGQRVARRLAPGKHVVELHASAEALVHGLIGIKGAVISRCAVDAARLIERPAAPDRGFAWPYLLAMPQPAAAGTAALPGANTLLVVPPNTGFATDDLELLRAAATCRVAEQLALADRLGTPILMPLFPRPLASPPADTLYLHALSRASLLATGAKLSRIDLQLIAMIDHARAALAAQERPIQPRVLIVGFSASGSFTNRFAVLHPDRVLAAAVGSPGGWPIAPVAVERREALPYPVGIADVEKLTEVPVELATLRRVRFLFFLGDADTNDAVPSRDSFSPDDEAQVMRLFGKTPVARWDAARRLYDTAGLRARFALYRGVGHQISPAMASDIEALFRAALAAP